jgi:hypothetical protein
LWALQSWGLHFYTILGFALGLFFGLVIFFGLCKQALILGLDGCNNFCVFFASFPLDSSLLMQ